MPETKKENKNYLNALEKLYFSSNVNEKQKPPISPTPNVTRELARRSLQEFQKNVEKIKEKIQNPDDTMEIDGSKLSGIKSGDFWVISKEGIKNRFFEKNESMLEGLLQRRTERIADPDKDVSLDQLFEILSYAQWAPNATNEQPTKIMIYQKNHPSMQRIGELMQDALLKRMIPNINIRNYIINRKKENPNFLPEYSLQDLLEMDNTTFNQFRFEEMAAPLDELPQTLSKLFERQKVVMDNGKYYTRKADGSKGDEYRMKDLLANDKLFTQGMGKFFLKFKNTHPYLIIIFRKWHYTSLMTETLYKYGITLPDVGEEYIDAGFYSDHLALATRGFGLSGVVKTGPLDLAKDELTELFIHDLEERLTDYNNILKSEQSLPREKTDMINQEIKKIKLLHDGLKYGLEAMRCKDQGIPLREQLLKAIKRGEVYVPATFFQLGYPYPQPEERIMDPRQGKDPLDSMIIFIGE